MKSVLLGFLAAVIGCAIFFLCLAGWYEMTGQGSGVSGRASADGAGSVVIVSGDGSTASQETAGSGTGTGSGSGTVTQGTGGSGTASQGTGGTGSGSASAAGTGNASASETSGAASSGESAASAAGLPGTVSDKAISDYINTITEELTADLGEKTHLSVERSARGITITMWEDNLVTDLSAGQKDDTTEELWQDKKEQLRRISRTYADRSAAAGLVNTHIVANLLNERNQSDIILSYEDGVLVHDGLDHD